MAYEDLIRHYFNKAEISLSSEITGKFSLYLEELFRWNEKINLTAITEPDEAVVKLFVDSSQPSFLIEEGDRILEIGSGAGFPGMVLALLCPGAFFTLAEARYRKIAFLKRIKTFAGAKNVEIIEKSLNKGDAPSLGAFDRIISRAAAKPERIASLSKHFIAEGGVLIIMGGTSEGISFGPMCFDRALSYTLPGGFGERKMCLYKKR